MKELLRLYLAALRALPAGARPFLWSFSVLLSSLAVFDAVSLALLAAVLGPVSIGEPVSLPGFGELDQSGVVLVIAAICVLLISKSVLAVALTYWVSRKMPKFEVAVGDRLFRAYISAPWRERLRKNSIEIMRFTDSGVDATINSFVLPGATLLAELVTLVVVVGTLALVEPIIAATSLVYMLLLGAVLFFWVARRARVAGEQNVAMSIRTSRLVMEIIAAMKEVTLRNKEPEVADVVAVTRTQNAKARASIFFLGEVPRYVLEAGLVGGFVVIGGVSMLIGGIEEAIAAVGLFALAGFRVAPSVNRFQAVLSRMVAVSPYAEQVLNEVRDVENSVAASRSDKVVELPAKPQTLRVRDVTFQYDPSAQPAVKAVSLDIHFGSSVAFVGASGSGKSTMVDLLLGLLEPTSGEIRVDDVHLRDARTSWRSRVGYVPQEVAIFDATVGQNVALTWNEEYDRERVVHALKQARLWDVVRTRDGGLDARVGERGLALSGGQRQRLGIARALYSEPLVLVMDEATSALDTATESQITDAISMIGDDVTKIVVAHRLATIRDFDQIVFMRDGAVAGTGTFDELVDALDDFAEQARLAGLV